jgi:flagellar M-ring protein FliF
MQHTNYQRALEGELSNTIKSIDGVEAATVHLVMPQKDVFADDQDKTTASVLVQTSPSKPLSSQQVQAIVHLVASSVEGLDPTQVTVAGADGKILSTGGGAAVATGADSGADSQTAAFQTRLNTSLQNMLDSVVGPGHAVVTTTAQLDYDQTETKTKTYTADPSLPALSESISREAYNGNGTGSGGVLGPDNIQVPNGVSSSSGTGQYESSSTTRNNTLNSVEETRKAAPGAVKKLSVAVLLDSTTAGTVNPAQVQQLVSAAAGIDATRGDTVAVSAMPFDTSAATAAKDALAASAAAEKSQKQTSLIRTGAMALVVLILLFLAWRASRRNKKRKALSPAELAHLEAMQVALEQKQLAELNAAIPSPALTGPSPEDLAVEERQREIEQMVEDQPEEISALLRGWLAAGR